MTPKLLGELLDKSEDALANDRYFKRGIPFTRIGSRIYYLRDDVICHLAANRHDPADDGLEAKCTDSANSVAPQPSSMTPTTARRIRGP